MTVRRIDHLTPGNAIFIGLSQVMALIPGASRSGITMTAGRMLGMERAEVARFSLLPSIPTIIGAATLIGVDLWRAGQLALRSEEHTYELQSLMRISYAVFCLKNKKNINTN